MAAEDFNDKHPELQPGEVWLTNSLEGFADVGMPDSSGIGFKTKRLGNIAYTKSGEVAKGYSPVFVQKSELDAHRTKTAA